MSWNRWTTKNCLPPARFLVGNFMWPRAKTFYLPGWHRWTYAKSSMSHPRDEHVSVNNNPYVVGGCYDGNKQKVFDGDRFAVLKEFGLLTKAGFRLRVHFVLIELRWTCLCYSDWDAQKSLCFFLKRKILILLVLFISIRA